MTPHEKILNGMARAFFACAWADLNDECGDVNESGCDIMDLMPEEVDPAAIKAAQRLSLRLVLANYKGTITGTLTKTNELPLVYKQAAALPKAGADRKLTPDLFGHYCAMQAMGTGVGLESFGYAVRKAIVVPNLEFSRYDLEREYFPTVDN